MVFKSFAATSYDPVPDNITPEALLMKRDYASCKRRERTQKDGIHFRQNNSIKNADKSHWKLLFSITDDVKVLNRISKLMQCMLSFAKAALQPLLCGIASLSACSAHWTHHLEERCREGGAAEGAACLQFTVTVT